jgi:hypothetical protein
MSFLKRFKKTIKKVTKPIAKVHRSVFKSAVKVNRQFVHFNVRVASRTAPYATGVLSAAASYLGGPVAGAAVAGLGSEASFLLRKEKGREAGESSKTRTRFARKSRKRAAIAGAIGLGAGAIGSGITTLALGGSLGQAGSATLLGQGGSQLLGTGAPGLFTPPQAPLSTVGPFGSFSPAVSGSQLSDVGYGGLEAPTSVSSFSPAGSSLSAESLTGGELTASPLAAPAASGTGFWGGLGQAALTGVVGAGAKAIVPSKTPNSGYQQEGALAGLLAGLGLGGGGGSDGGSSGNSGFPQIGDAGGPGGGTDWMNLLLIAGGTFVVGKYVLKVF